MELICFLCLDKVNQNAKTHLDSLRKKNVDIPQLLKNALDRDVSDSELDSKLICKRCFLTLQEFYDAEQRMIQLKQQMQNKLKKKLETSPTKTENQKTVKVERDDAPSEIIVLNKTSPIKETTSSGINQQLLINKDITLTRISSSRESTDREDSDSDEKENLYEIVMPSKDSNENQDQMKEIQLSSEDSFDVIEYETEFLDAVESDKDENDTEEEQFQKIEDDSPTSKTNWGTIKENLFEKIEDIYYRCLLCPQNDSDELYVGTDCFEESQLQNHIREKHSGEKLNIKNVQVKLKPPKTSKESSGTDKNIMKMKYNCEECDRSFLSKKLLEDHKFIHTGAKPYTCSQCGKGFCSRYTLSTHMKIHTDRPRNFQCQFCDKKFLTQANLSTHEKLHTSNKEYKCEDCGKCFNSPHNLEVHRIVHSGVKPFVCRTCGKNFARRAEIKDHERVHTKEKPFECDLCGVRFAQRSNLQSHKRATHFNDLRHKCTECDKGFKRKRLLDYHVKAAHTGERPYACTICPSTFVYPEHFKKHLKIHEGVKPYSCEICSKKFSSRDNRNTHRFVHSDKKPYECSICNTGFMRKPQLYSHMTQRNHESDTIIVNQPKLTKDGILFVNNNTELKDVLDTVPDLQDSEMDYDATIEVDEADSETDSQFCLIEKEDLEILESGKLSYEIQEQFVIEDIDGVNQILKIVK